MQLLVADLALLDAAMEGDEALGRALGGHAVAHDWQGFPNAVRRLREAVATDPGWTRWGPRLFIHQATLVGWGGFKGPPSDGIVEIGYAVAPAWQGRGLATAAVGEMLREAYAADDVDAVIAHTLPEHNASVRVLEKAGFAAEGGAAEWRFRHVRPLS